MLGIGIDEIFVIAILFLIFVGPKGMPTTFRAVGKALREFRKSMREIRHQVGIDELLQQDLLQDTLEQHKASLKKSILEQPKSGESDPTSDSPFEEETIPYSPLSNQSDSTEAQSPNTNDIQMDVQEKQKHPSPKEES